MVYHLYKYTIVFDELYRKYVKCAGRINAQISILTGAPTIDFKCEAARCYFCKNRAKRWAPFPIRPPGRPRRIGRTSTPTKGHNRTTPSSWVGPPTTIIRVTSTSGRRRPQISSSTWRDSKGRGRLALRYAQEANRVINLGGRFRLMGNLAWRALKGGYYQITWIRNCLWWWGLRPRGWILGCLWLWGREMGKWWVALAAIQKHISWITFAFANLKRNKKEMESWIKVSSRQNQNGKKNLNVFRNYIFFRHSYVHTAYYTFWSYSINNTSS